ncbi:Alpha/Beta hydrolase protein [Pyrenochaeta sp. MPI-SDFR-AT-0127]|nr:Alpha/Beta hydrolase protein [Pyrenochaeta sp. MPI-SDFR-AT-0127]
MANNISKRVHTIPASFPRCVNTVINPSARLQLVVDEYVIPTPSRDGFTLLFTHGTSFNKSLWELVIRTLLNNSSIAPYIKRVLAVDAINHGDSALANKGKLSKDKAHWPDISRDILQVLKHFGVEAPVIGIGHSFGGGALAHASIMAPSAFWATIFVEPIIFLMKGQTQGIADMTLKRRDRWESYEEAKAAFDKSRGMADWVPQQRQKYIDEAIYQTRTGDANFWTLKTTKEQEAATYLAAPVPGLPELLEASRQRHYFILGEKSVVLNTTSRARIEEISHEPGWVKTLPGVGHLVPMTHPDLLASELARALHHVVVSKNTSKL